MSPNGFDGFDRRMQSLPRMLHDHPGGVEAWVIIVGKRYEGENEQGNERKHYNGNSRRRARIPLLTPQSNRQDRDGSYPHKI
jgi:hypothetical protein